MPPVDRAQVCMSSKDLIADCPVLYLAVPVTTCPPSLDKRRAPRPTPRPVWCVTVATDDSPAAQRLDARIVDIAETLRFAVGPSWST